METESISILQLPLFVYGESITNVVELFPAIWKATESLASADRVTRQHGLDALLELGAQRVSPLVAYTIATCINDMDIPIRRRVVYILADLLTKELDGSQTTEEVRRVVTHFLYHMREESILDILEISVTDSNSDPSLYHLFDACPYAGKYLADILTQWKNPLPIRQKAIYFIGLVGFVEARPALERLFNRLEARQSGQYLMDFAPSTIKTDDDLLPYLRIAMSQLSAG